MCLDDHLSQLDVFPYRDAPSVSDLGSMVKLMRYNNYTRDPLSRCQCHPPYSGENAISARNDLNPRNGTYPFHALSHRYRGVRTKFGYFNNLKFTEFHCFEESYLMYNVA